jgi:hypothetical protein
MLREDVSVHITEDVVRGPRKDVTKALVVWHSGSDAETSWLVWITGGIF